MSLVEGLKLIASIVQLAPIALRVPLIQSGAKVPSIVQRDRGISRRVRLSTSVMRTQTSNRSFARTISTVQEAHSNPYLALED